MGQSAFGKIVLSVSAVAGLIAVVAACHDRDDDFRDCDYVDRRCRTRCDYTCDYYSCYPVCWDDCWNECGYDPAPPPSSSTSGTVPFDAGVSISDGAAPPATDGGGGGGTGVLCTKCSSTNDCEKGALCILRGGGDAGTKGTCGAACQTSNDCPTGFLCSQIGASRQCLPTGNACE